jgi:V-type H+-transporting ATPase subunit G
MSSSQQLIQKLLKAEEEAEQLISRARDNRVRKLREAKQAADDEIEIFRRKEEERFQGEITKGQADEDSNQMHAQIDAELKAVSGDYEKNKAKIVEYMTNKVLGVKPELTPIQIALLQAASGSGVGDGSPAVGN